MGEILNGHILAGFFALFYSMWPKSGHQVKARDNAG
jgi:hypothetical protein